MTKKLKLILILATVLFAVTSVSAQNIDAVIGSKDSSSAFQIMNSEGDTVITLGSNGSGIFRQFGLVRRTDQVQINTPNYLLFMDGRDLSGRSSNRHIYLMSGGNLTLDTPVGQTGEQSGAKIELFSGSSGGGINILGGSHVDGWLGFGEIKIQPGDGNDLNLFGGDVGSFTNGSSGGDVNIKAGGYNSSVIISSSGGDSGIDAGDIVLKGGEGYEDRGGDVILEPGVASFGGVNGTVILNGSGTYSGTWAQASDKRFKKNIQSINNTTEKFIRLEPVTYELRKEEFPDKHFEDGEQIGLIAQDVEKLFPQLVKNDEDGYKTVDYTKLSVLAIKAIKSQNDRVSALEEKIDNLEVILSNQKNLIEQVQYLLEKEKQNIKSTKI